MKKLLAALGLAAFALSACHDDAPRQIVEKCAPLDPANPHVYVTNGRFIVVDQEPLHFLLPEHPEQPHDPVNITWHLPKDGGYRFAKNGISVSKCADNDKGASTCADRNNAASRDINGCDVLGDGTEYRCVNALSTEGRFKYTITVVDKDNKQLPPQDPSGDNNKR